MRRRALALIAALCLGAPLACGGDDGPDGSVPDATAPAGAPSAPGGDGDEGDEGGGPSATAEAVEGVAWVLDPDESSSPGGPLPDTGAGLRLADGEVTGDDGCNRFSGTYRIDGDRIEVADLASTEMACIEPPDAMERAERLTGALRSGATVREAVPERLVLDAGDGSTLVYGPAAPATPATAEALVGAWAVTLERTDGEGPDATVSSTPAGTIAFHADGTWDGRGPCNGWGGRWRSPAPGQLTLDEAGAGQVSCGAEVDEAEAATLDALAATTNYSVLGGDAAFDLTSPDAAVRLLLAPADSGAAGPAGEGGG